jgi:hypothetical protein
LRHTVACGIDALHPDPMRRLRIKILVLASIAALMGVLVVPASASASARQVPVLGQKHLFKPGGRGWGHRHPAKIFNGGDPSGLVRQISWHHWGSHKAFGRGLGNQFKPGGGYYAKPVKVQLRATGLGRCTSNGPHAYTKLHVRLQKKPGSSRWTSWFRWAGMKRICKA